MAKGKGLKFAWLLFVHAVAVFGIVVTVIFISVMTSDQGHCAYAVTSEEARATIVDIFTKWGGMKPLFTFDSGSSHQTLMNDGKTVVHYLEEKASRELQSTGNARSIVVANPKEAAEDIVYTLSKHHFDAQWHDLGGDRGVVDLPENSLILIQTNALRGCDLVVRKDRHYLPEPHFR